MVTKVREIKEPKIFKYAYKMLKFIFKFFFNVAPLRFVILHKYLFL